MRRLALICATIGGLLASPSLALAQSPQTQASVASLILSMLPTNGQQQITASALRTTLNAMNSAIFQNNVSMIYNIGPVNLNLVADTPFSFFLPNGLPNYQGAAVRLYNCSASASSASVAVYTGAGASGFALVAPTAVTINTAGPNATTSSQAVVGTNSYSNSTALFFRVTVAEGSPVTCSAIFTLNPAP